MNCSVSTPRVPKFSIITVCFNAIGVLPETLTSLRQQSCHDFEWVVVDGASTDGSTAWLAQQHPDVFVTEPDKGIYDAMNKAIALANGEWLFFLNAGDQFADGSVLADVAASIEQTAGTLAAPRLIYGDVIYFGMNDQRRKRFHWLTRHRLLFGDLCHQAAFANKKLFTNLGLFDTSLRFNADFDWFIRVFQSGTTLQYLARDIALFNDAGTHVTNHKKSEIERNGVRARYINRQLWKLGHGALRLELKIRKLLGQAL